MCVAINEQVKDPFQHANEQENAPFSCHFTTSLSIADPGLGCQMSQRCLFMPYPEDKRQADVETGT